MFVLYILLCLHIISVKAAPVTESFKNQHCTDPRTMKKHAAYTEWADAYSCTRHRCQPGGRSLAIYTVGCKRVEPPESAIECEEVVEDTNMQFPYCCPRLRCLVVVRGEVWTRVLGQPWETLPAAPWSHMYKMKKPPPTDNTFLPKTGEGPIYELAVENEEDNEKVLRASKKSVTEGPDCKDLIPRANAPPDIVIALATAKDERESKLSDIVKRKRVKKPASRPFSRQDVEDEIKYIPNEVELEEIPSTTEKRGKARQITWTEIPPSQWSDRDLMTDSDGPKEPINRNQEYQIEQEKKDERSSNLQALVDAIGSRMRDIENVVQRMSQKVHHVKPEQPEFGNSLASVERRADIDIQTRKNFMIEPKEHENEVIIPKPMRPNPESEPYVRSKHLRGEIETTSEQPLYVEDTNLNGYFSDVSNNILRRAEIPKEPLATYMAPVDNNVKQQVHTLVENSEEVENSIKKKHSHKKKKTGKGHKKHHVNDDKKSRYNRKKSTEIEKNVVSLEDSSSVTT
ncbi:uncharacterized protein [Battus philenor]|uniref:uncharacterized protein n=1 Tax=Battus philenor TaxID=42288 RepID=UPI0035D10AEE